MIIILGPTKTQGGRFLSDFNFVFNFIYIQALLYGRLVFPFDLLAWALGWRKDVRALRGTIDVTAATRIADPIPCLCDERSPTCASLRMSAHQRVPSCE